VDDERRRRRFASNYVGNPIHVKESSYFIEGNRG
jgi:hypothetical protein